MHSLLVKIRAEIDNLSSAYPNESLEAKFKGNLICHVSDGGTNPHATSISSVPVAVKKLSTTTAARRQTMGQVVAPALNAKQLDSFIDAKAPPGIFSKLETSNVGFFIYTYDYQHKVCR